MASNAKKTEGKRTNRDRKQGKARKRALAKKGTTRTEAEIFGNVLKG